ncbi:MAG: Hpt domain-containing protein [Clostridia bacterium]|nr:Hpt domain-containing protein [Clostridia bacterium]
MKLKECYERMGADYNGVLLRIGDEEKVVRILGMLLRDENMRTLRDSFKKRDYETAFRAVHTIKGVALNLGLSRLADSASALTEALRTRREGSPETAALLERTEADYKEALAQVRALLEPKTEQS